MMLLDDVAGCVKGADCFDKHDVSCGITENMLKRQEFFGCLK